MNCLPEGSLAGSTLTVTQCATRFKAMAWQHLSSPPCCRRVCPDPASQPGHQKLTVTALLLLLGLAFRISGIVRFLLAGQRFLVKTIGSSSVAGRGVVVLLEGNLMWMGAKCTAILARISSTHTWFKLGIDKCLGPAGDNEERTTINKRTSGQLRRGKMSSGNGQLASEVVDLLPGDGIVANSKISEKPDDGKLVIDDGHVSNTLQGHYDKYDGVIVDPDCLPPDVSTFTTYLTTSIALWKQQERHGIWLQIPIEKVNLVEPAVKAGFTFHHAESEYLMLTLWLPDRPCTLPPNASHQVGIGAFVLNHKNEVLAVQENNGPLKGTGIWKLPTGLINQGEDIFTGAIREVKEETGVDAEFVECVGFRQGHEGHFTKSDLFFVCILRPLSTQIVKQESEIAAAQWIPLLEFQAQPFYTESPFMRMSLEVCIAHAKGNYVGFAPHNYVREGSERLPQYFYHKPTSVSAQHLRL